MWEACEEGVGPPGCPRHLRRGLGVVAPRQEGVHGLPPTVRPSVGSLSPFLSYIRRTEDNDVALLRLKRPILMGPRVQVVP